MQHDLRLTIFWVVHLLMLGLFCAELIWVLSVWFKARVPGLPADAPRWQKFKAVIRLSVSLLLSRRIWILLKALVVDGMVHRRLAAKDRQRWMAHIFVFGSWLVLGIFSTLTGVSVEILPLLGMSPDEVVAIPLLGQLYHADVGWVALVNDLLGLVTLVGMALILWRRYGAKDPQLRTMPADTVILVLMTLIVLGGFPTETFRLLADYTQPGGVFAPAPTLIALEKLPLGLYDVWGPQWGFVGYLPAVVLGALKLEPGVWEVFHNLFFWSHFVIVTALLFLLPFSRFFHVIMSPVIVAYNTMLATDASHGSAMARQERPQPASQGGENL